MTRIQRERFEDPVEYEKYRGHYILTRELVEKGAYPDILIMPPLPRIDEIATDGDDLSNAAYFSKGAERTLPADGSSGVGPRPGIEPLHSALHEADCFIRLLGGRFLKKNGGPALFSGV